MVTQGTETEIEGVVEPAKIVEPTQPKEEPTAKYTEEDFQRAVSKGLESTTRQLDLTRAEAKSAKAEAGQNKSELDLLSAQFKELQSENDRIAEEKYVDDPEARRAFLDRKSIADDRRKVAREKAEAEQKYYEAEKLAWSVRMAQKAQELHGETDIPIKDLEDCQTEEEMEVKALRFKLEKEPEKPEETETPKFAGAGGDGGGTDLSKMSPEDKFDFGLKKLTKK